jgi:hypothetical protein
MRHRYCMIIGLAPFLWVVGLSVVIGGCSSPRSVGVTIGDRQEPDYRVAHKQTGPPPHAPAHGYRKKFGYDYYSAANVYYDRGRKVYFYLAGNNWEMGVSLPSTLRVNVNEAIYLELGTDRPYQRNAEHVKMGKYKHKGKAKKVKHKHPWK